MVAKKTTAAQVALLSQLSFSDAIAPAATAQAQDPLVVRRLRFAESCKLQIELCKADIGQTVFTAARKKYVTVMKDGKPDTNPDGSVKRSLEEVQVSKFKRWHFALAGVWYIRPKYSVQPLFAAPKSSVVAGKTLASVETMLNTLLKGCEAGELDDHLRKLQLGRSKQA